MGCSELPLGIQPIINWQDHAADLFDDDHENDDTGDASH